MAKTHATVDALFTKRILELTAQAKAAATAALTGQGAANAYPAEKISPFDIAGTTKIFDRKDIGAEYQAVVGSDASAGSAGDAMSLTIQSDYLAVMERAHRAQYASPIRLMGMAAARLHGHGHPGGVLAGGVLSHVQDLIVEGQKT